MCDWTHGYEVGNFCNRVMGMDPPLQSGNLAPTCMPQREVQGNCFKKKGYPDKVAPYWRYHHANDRKKGNYKPDTEPVRDEVCGTTLLINWTINITSSCATRTLAEKTTAVERSRERMSSCWNARQSQDEKEI